MTIAASITSAENTMPGKASFMRFVAIPIQMGGLLAHRQSLGTL